ncbi:MAG: hypothetical protein UY85_C0041G0010 [Candidatus Peribacteria bacterium GW2011_GWB1_54_5]|nr:MAG: hypothetical protein UY85_C0041G0010 [Candidatus Peribacteria bacterium GW2011_GWB1_54_5]KKW41177.1 MAG: hypothetical protein UY87_C0002G0008 [Candidatus Peribacteria bacterium GW2011_GWC2_54_8]
MTNGQQPPVGGTPPLPPPPPQGASKPVRPGDQIPTGGLDPTQVFSSPPPPPPQAAAGAQPGVAAGGQPAGAQPPQDQGPPPPPPGVAATKEMGYDDEDIRVLGEVGNYRFSSISSLLTNNNIAVPTHPETRFDEQRFLTLLRGSISLTRDEKWRIIQAIPKLSQFQIDELQKILDEEKRKFSELSPKHLLQLMKLEQKHSEDWKDLQSISVQQNAQASEQQQAEEIRKQLGL